jgi:micrococcal nuclease
MPMSVHASKKWLGPGLLAAATLALVGWKKFKETNHPDTFLHSLTVESPSQAAGTFRLIRIIDGDTIVVADMKGEIHVRLIGIDAPEKNQSYGSKSTTLVRSLIGQKSIRLSGTGKDRYGRILSHVYAGDTWVNMEMVKLGAAWVYRAKPDTFWADLNDAERDARNNRRGLWADPSPIYPGDWRKR